MSRNIAPLFFATHADRVSLAKKKYFEEGVLPTGVVSEAVFQSWSRCYRANLRSVDKVEFEPVSTSRNQLALQKNRVLLDAWFSELPALGTALGSAGCSAILTDATGVLIGASPAGQHAHHIIPIAHRVGVNLAEAGVGTSAPGIVARTGKQASVLGSEHYYDSVSAMHCTAAPIRNIHGTLAGILDISSEGMPFHFDPAAVVGLYASSIENRLLIAQSPEHLIVKFQLIPAIIATPMVGMLGFALDGQLVWMNSVASHLLGVPVALAERGPFWVGDIFAINFSQLASLSGAGVVSQRLSSGLHVFLTCEIRQKSPSMAGHVGASDMQRDRWIVSEGSPSFNEPLDSAAIEATAPLVDSLKQADAELIQKYLSEYKGNISLVARRLKVSRGLIYRRLEELRIDHAIFKNR